MLWMIVNCLAISRGCERDKSTIKFDRLPPIPPPPPPPPLICDTPSLPSISLIFPFLCLRCPLRLTPTSPSQFTLSSFCWLHKQLRGGEGEVSSLWCPLWLCPPRHEDFREIAPLSVALRHNLQHGTTVGNPFTGQGGGRCAHMIIISPSWVGSVPTSPSIKR